MFKLTTFNKISMYVCMYVCIFDKNLINVIIMRKKFTRILVMLVVVVATSVQAFAYDLEYQGIYYSKIDNNTWAVTSAPADNPYRGKIEISASVPVQDGMIKIFCPVVAIGEKAFWNCSAVTEVIIPEGVTTIEESAFSKCGLTKVTIPETITTIGTDAFCECIDLTAVTIPQGVIGRSAFSSCYNLAEVTISEGVTEIGQNAFYACGSLEKVTIPASVTTIGPISFVLCTSLTEVKILGEVTEIGFGTFAFCSSLESIELPSSLESIGDMAFLGCESLKTITLPSKVSSIGDAAFSGCTGLESITSNNPVPPTCTQAAFDAISDEEVGEFAGVNKDIPVYVPDGKVSDYKTGGWLYFYETITKVEDSLIGDAVEVERYDISGRKISKPVQGVNIVRYSNGAVRKEVR